MLALTLIALAGAAVLTPVRAQDRRVAAALATKFPDGHRRCLGLGASAGISRAGFPAGTLFFPTIGVTAPDRHVFVLWSGRADAPVPDLVAELAQRGLVTRTEVQATVDAEETIPGPQMISPAGIYYHPTLYHHKVDTFAIAIYLTRPNDPAFQFEGWTSLGQSMPGVYQRATFPSRFYDIALPPANTHYLIPTGQPYATSVVTSACLSETLASIDAVEEKSNFFVGKYVEAKVTYRQSPPLWMSTPAFRRAAYTPTTVPVEGSRQLLMLFRIVGDRFEFVEESP